MCQSQTFSAPRGWVPVLRGFAQRAASTTRWAIDVMHEVNMLIASLSVRAKGALPTEVSVVAQYSRAVDG